jgi:hypothetical protein
MQAGQQVRQLLGVDLPPWSETTLFNHLTPQATDSVGFADRGGGIP